MAVDMGALTDMVAMGFGGLFVLFIIAYILLTRRPGREGDEAAHEKAVSKGCKQLRRSHQIATTDPDEDWLNQLDWLVEQRESTARHRRPWQWLRRRSPRSIVAHGRVIQDADGRDIHLLSLNGRRLAHRDPEALLEDGQTVVQALANYETPPATMSERYYEDVTDGWVDIEDTRRRVHGDCLTRIQSNMRRANSLDYQDLYDRLVFDRGFRYPPSVVHQKLEELEGRELRRREDGEITYQRFV